MKLLSCEGEDNKLNVTVGENKNLCWNGLTIISTGLQHRLVDYIDFTTGK